MKIIKNILIIITLIWAVTVNAQTCKENITATTPDSRFTENVDGTVTDKKTNLIWMRCALGQTWGGITCSGDAVTYTWQQALQEANSYNFASSSKWRVPNIKELASISELTCVNPSINLEIFPETPISPFWTASNEHAYHAVFYIDFYNSSGRRSYNGNKLNNYYVRLVHSDSN